MGSMTVRERAAQIVWPSVFGDYVSGDSPQWRRLTQYIQQEKVGGFTISVGSPIEVAAKLNALQSMSKIPLLFGADLETLRVRMTGDVAPDFTEALYRSAL